MLRTLLLSLALLLSGCASLAPSKPEVSLAGVSLVEAGLFEQRFALKLRVQNTGRVSLPLDGLAFEVEMNGQPFARGVSAEPVSVPGLGEAVLTVNAVSNLSSLLRQLRELKNSGGDKLTYRIHGTLDAGLYGRLPFEHRGEIDTSRLLGDTER